jgi:hypothetical protein
MEMARPNYQHWCHSMLQHPLGMAAHKESTQTSPPMAGYGNNVNLFVSGKSGKLFVYIFSHQHHRLRMDWIEPVPDLL